MNNLFNTMICFILLQFYQVYCRDLVEVDWMTPNIPFVPGRLNRTNHQDSPIQLQQQVPYTCFEPVDGLSDPVITVLSIIRWPRVEVERFVRINRLIHAKAQGYRFCELNEPADKGRILRSSRIPFVLSILPCTDYVVYMDSDAIVYDPTYHFGPWINYMEEENIDLLLSTDYQNGPPINFGVFIARRADWTYKMLRSLHNTCACDWHTIDEVSIIHAWLQRTMNDGEFNSEKHVKIASSEGWNTHWNTTNTTTDDNFVVHYQGCCPEEAQYRHKFMNMMQSYITSPYADVKFSKKDYLTGKGFCIPIVWKQLMHLGDVTGKAYESSLLDYDLTEKGELKRVELNSLNCVDLGNDDKKCSLLADLDNTNHTIYYTRSETQERDEKKEQ
eukprot:TRINITY_DN309_c0_g2_i1.p1 TRINITY_DN309_c0_g2~~TRINITY_DN309_c0_g2_i1.p1  ORF type:complete len:388 (-),score=26.17 TRINITY_DN309_c0_g2_i1:1578-2741(-)